MHLLFGILLCFHIYKRFEVAVFRDTVYVLYFVGC